MKSLYITTPIYYVNDIPHIGHAYTSIICDVISRFNRLNCRNVKFSTGTDEHGQKIKKSAKKHNLSPQQFVDKISQHFLDLTASLNLSNDDFIRTTEERHKKSAKNLWKNVAKNNFLYKGIYKGWYSIQDEAFYQEKELVNSKAPTGSDVEWVEEESYFFRLSAFQNQLLNLYKTHPNFIFPKHYHNEVVSFVESGLKDISVSRTNFSWGIKVPDDEKHVMYVWFDALSNYLTATCYPSTKALDYWNNSKILHVIGKDILRFHAVYWPAFLIAANLSLPHQILVHGWWTNEGEKISKSVGNTINPIDLIDEFGADCVRYFLLREVTFGKDGNFSRNAIIQRINSDLANNIGNLLHRTLSMVNKHFDGKIPKGCKDVEKFSSEVYENAKHACINLEKNNFNEALDNIIAISSMGNEYIDKTAPWKLKDSDKKRMGEILYNLLEAIRCIGILMQPFVPESAKKILTQISSPQQERSMIHAQFDFSLKEGVDVATSEIIFTKF